MSGILKQVTEGFRDNSGTYGHSVFFSGGYFARKSIIKLTAFTGGSNSSQAYLATSETDLQSNYRINYLRPDERDDFQQTLIMLQLSTMLSPNSFFQSTVYYNHLNGNYEVYANPDMLNFALKSEFSGAMMNYQYEKNNLQFNAGLHANDYQRDHFQRVRPDLSKNLYFNSGKKKEASAFAQGIYAIERFLLFADVQLRTVRVDYVPDVSVQLPFKGINWTFFKS